MLRRRIGRRTAIALAGVVAALLLGVVFIETLSGSLLGASPLTSAYTSDTSTEYGMQPENLTQFVNPFIGTSNNGPFGGGNTFPGATYPMGMVQWSPDTVSNPAGGYSYNDSVIKDVSLTHFSGRGCTVYQDFPFMPFVGNISASPSAQPSSFYSSFKHESEVARPGYYRVHLDGPNVTVALTATLHTGVGQFVFPASKLSTMIINAGGSINGNSNSAVLVSSSKDEVTGFEQSTVGCGSNPYTLYFAAAFDHSFVRYGVWDGGTIYPGSTERSGQHTGAYVVFDTTSSRAVDVQVGVSFVSVANAQLNLHSEYARFDVASVARNSAAAWNYRLNAIRAGGGAQNETTAFYTALYHVFFHPNIFNDVNGQYLGFDGKVHTVPTGHAQYENIPGWDDYRTQIQLLSILEPSVASDIAQSLVNDAEQNGGTLPRWEQANADSHGMSGDGGAADIAEAYAFGAANFDTSAALQAMVNGQSKEREGYADYARLGYVPADTHPGFSTASITLEYATDDFAVSQFAKALGDSTDYNTFLRRSGSWMNLFNNASGYAQPRDSNGSWEQGFSPTSQSGFQEGDSAQYSWMVSFDLRDLFARMGGNSTAVSRLEITLSQLNGGPDCLCAWMGNEPSIEIPWEYDFAQAPSQTQRVVRLIETQLWSDAPRGIPGNDDGGEMSSWYVFATLGFYPEVAGVGGFVIGSPLFPSITVNLSGGHTLQVDAQGAADSQPYVQGLELDGSPTSSLWLPWSSVQNGATLVFSLGANPSSWGSSPQDAPPSFP